MCIYAKFNVGFGKTVGFRKSHVLKLLFFWQEFSENVPNNAHSNGFYPAFLDLKFAGFAQFQFNSQPWFYKAVFECAYNLQGKSTALPHFKQKHHLCFVSYKVKVLV